MSRIKKAGGSRLRQRAVGFSDDMWKKLRAVAAMRGVTMSQLIREAVEAFLADAV